MSRNPESPMDRRLYTYIVSTDTGLAPNPFWGVCTLAVCTPNHMGSRAKPGDWIAGFLSKQRANRFLYAMEVDEVLGLDEYYGDARFERKKPNLRGSWMERCGDNFYSMGADGAWIQHRNRFHLSDSLKQQDTRYARVFIAHRFWYLGRAAAELPLEYRTLVGGRPVRVNHDPELVRKFMSWVESDMDAGVSDAPNDNPDMDL